MATDRPWSKFFWTDWESDERLRQCSLAAQGLWMRMLCICAKGEPTGYLAVAGNPLDASGVARSAGIPQAEAETLMAELEEWGVFSRDRKGRIFSRRMVKDAKKANTAEKNGKKGGNPALGPTPRKQRENRPSDNPPDKGEDKPQRPEARYTPNGDSQAVSDEKAEAYQVAREIFGKNPDPGTVVSRLLSIMSPTDVLSVVHTSRNKTDGWQYLWGVYKRKAAEKRGKSNKATAGDRAWEAIGE